MGTYNNPTFYSVFCVVNNPEWNITYKKDFYGEYVKDENGKYIIESEEPTIFNGLSPQEICEKALDIWCSKNADRTGAVIYCVSAKGLHHLHMVLETDGDKRFHLSTVKKLFPKVHLEPTRGSKKQAEDYIYKRGKFAEKGEQIIAKAEHGEIKGVQGKRTDLEQIQEYINIGLTPSAIFDKDIRYRKYEKIITDAYYAKRKSSTPLERDVSVYWYYGEKGSGKTHTYIDVCDAYGDEHVYKVDEYESGCFDKYNGEEILFLNEYRGQFKYASLLSKLEGYQGYLHARYTDRVMLWDAVYITSPYSPFELYKDLPKEDSKQQLYRRISKVVHCYAEPTDEGTIVNHKIIIDFDGDLTEDDLSRIISFAKKDRILEYTTHDGRTYEIEYKDTSYKPEKKELKYAV